MNRVFQNNPKTHVICAPLAVVYPGILFAVGGGGLGQQIQLRTEDRQKGDPGAVAP
jgi:hypothetical protein